ncbi:zinc-dependent metalloprotease family protein [Lentisalinibacter sediminis]|uniref:zinc-dependent metalloprotease family protein n=1 Tax=Lentisalinibacter sediminis TaxID=2992237 RepID=UPI00386B80C5
MHRLTRLLWLLPLLALTPAPAPSAAAADVTIVHHESPQGWRFDAAPTGGGTLGFTAFGRSWRLELAPNARLSAALGRSGAARNAGVELYRGRIAGVPGSWLRLTRGGDGGWAGLMWDGGELFALESAAALPVADDGAEIATRPAAEPGGVPVVFRLADMRLAPGALGCAVAEGPVSPAGSAKADFDGLVAELAKTVESEIDIAVLADADFAARHPDPLAALATRLNNIDGIFSEQVGVTINVTDFRVFTAANDPLTDSTDPSTLLSDLGDYKSGQPDLRNLGLVHLYTGRDLDEGTAGIAYLSALCSTRFGAGLSEGRHGVTRDSLIGAHEIGHNFGSPHDGEDGSACESTPQNFLMAPRLNGSSTFSACSLEQMAPRVASAFCLKALPDADMTIAAAASPATVLEGGTVNLEVTASNLGTATAELVSMSVDLPAGVSLRDAGALCTAAAGGAECTIGTVAAGGSATANLTLAAVDEGRVDLAVEVRADSDTQPSNNTATAALSIDPAADLGIALQAPATLTRGTRATLDLAVTNASPRTATGVVVTVSTPAFLEPAAAPGTANCTVTAGAVRCEAAALAGGDTLTIELAVDAAREGTGTVEAVVSAAQGDPDEADNTTSRSIEVSSAAAATSGGGGGGGHGLWLLLLMAGWLGAARRSA